MEGMRDPSASLIEDLAVDEVDPQARGRRAQAEDAVTDVGETCWGWEVHVGDALGASHKSATRRIQAVTDPPYASGGFAKSNGRAAA
jgi:hypothetical protein